MKKVLVWTMVAGLAGSVLAGGWKNLSDSAWFSGPKLTDADLQGKVVLVDCWGVNCGPCRALLPVMQQLWESNKAKPFMLVGSHRQGFEPKKVRDLVAQNGLTFPIYNNFGVASGEPSFNGIPYLYVLDHRGKMIYNGYNEDEAVKVALKAVKAVGAPPNLTAGVTFAKYRPLKDKIRLGLPVKGVVKQLKAEVAKMEKKPVESQAAQLAEAKAILLAIDEGRTVVREEIELQKEKNPPEALKLIKLYQKTYPEEGAQYTKEAIAELEDAADEWRAAEKQRMKDEAAKAKERAKFEAKAKSRGSSTKASKPAR